MRAGRHLIFVFASVVLTAFSSIAQTNYAKSAIASRFADVDGLKLHYLAAGSGPAVIVIHGYAETSRMWRPLIPRLASKFTVIAPDLPGIGDSAIPKDGMDMKTAAIRIHDLAKSLGIQKPKSSATISVLWSHMPMLLNFPQRPRSSL